MAAITEKKQAIKAAAQKYVDSQLEALRKAGRTAALTPEQYQALVRKVAVATGRR